MLFFAILSAVTGYTLTYAGLHKGDNWRKPWQPVADALSGVQADAGIGPNPIGPAAGAFNTPGAVTAPPASSPLVQGAQAGAGFLAGVPWPVPPNTRPPLIR